MNSIPIKPFNDPRVAQLIDANLDRAREGLRVVEDWCRFGLRREDLVVTLKDWRQKLAAVHQESYKFARSTKLDKGLGLSHPAQNFRESPLHIVAANCARAEEALRVLEEFSRKSDPELTKTASEIRYGLYDIEIKILKATKYKNRLGKLLDCKLCLITKPKENLKDIVIKALEAGLKMVQYRCKEGDDIQKFSQAKELASISKSYDALFIVNDRIDIALAVNADGVHLGQNDLSIQVARNLMGKEKIIGRSTHSLEQIQIAEEEGADYLGVGPINETDTKPLLQPLGIDYIHEASNVTKLPWFAIGGVDNQSLKLILKAGAHRVAIAGAIINSKDPFTQTYDFLECLK